jgi:hypothetical protein
MHDLGAFFQTPVPDECAYPQKQPKDTSLLPLVADTSSTFPGSFPKENKEIVPSSNDEEGTLGKLDSLVFFF